MENENTNIENYTIQEDYSSNIVTLNTIHNDLGIITSFLCIASVVILIFIMYKFFRIFF